MKIFQPIWVQHDDKPIFSLDIHPDGSRVATGGQGNDCGRVVIWNMAPIKNEKCELDPSVPKMLCQMDNHLGCVNCVRWSLNGQMLASGGDDKIIMIWRRSKGTGSSFGGFAKNHENWRCVHTLRGHEGDVLDLAWSPGDRWLASSSVDNSVFVWDFSVAGQAPTVMSILKGHTGLVKGVAWDPIGKYVASQSDDRSVKIWKTVDWSCDSTITDPFLECGGTTHILRLSWSPDGQYLVSAHAMNGGGPTAQIIDREGWKCDKDFVGHRKAVTCVRFHNSIMMRTAPKSSKAQQYCCLAIGSRDKSISIWMTALNRPTVVIYDVFQDSVLDLSWSTDGYVLMACSGDGTVVFIQFSEEDLGTPLSETDKNAIYQRMYGKSVNDMNVSTDKDVIIENAEFLNKSSESLIGGKLSKPVPTFLAPELKVTSENYPRMASRMDERCESSSSLVSTSMTATTATTASPIKQAIHKQIETRTKDGKRRITPMFIPLSQDVDMEERSGTGGGGVVTGELQSSSSTSISTVNMVIEKQIKSSDDNMLLRTEEERNRMDSRLAKVHKDMPPVKIDSSLINEATTTAIATTAQSMALNGAAGGNTRSLFLSTNRPETFNAGVSRIVGNNRFLIQNHFQKMSATSTTTIHRVACYGNQSTAKLPLNQQTPTWQCITGSPICNFNSCNKYISIGCLDGSVRFLDIRSGCLVLPLITLANAIVQSAFCLGSDSDDPHCEAGDNSKDLAGVVTETGVLRIWDLKRKKIDLAVMCQDLLRTGNQSVGGTVSTSASGGQSGQGGAAGAASTTIVMLSITENGAVFIVLGNGTSYCYDRSLDSWLVLNGKDLLQQRALIRCAPTQILSGSTMIAKDMRRYPLTSIQTSVLGMISSSTIQLTMAQGGPTGTGSEWEAMAQLAFIENQIKLCEAINSPDELKYWYSSLGFNLALCGGTDERLRLVLDDLLGPIYARAETHNKRQILGIRKLDLLELVLEHINGQTKWQRVVMEYSDQLKELKKNILLK